MIVPGVANKVLWHTIMMVVTAESLLHTIAAIDVFDIRRQEAQIKNTGPMPNAWWQDGGTLLHKYAERSVIQIIEEAHRFFHIGTVEVSNWHSWGILLSDQWEGWCGRGAAAVQFLTNAQGHRPSNDYLV